MITLFVVPAKLYRLAESIPGLIKRLQIRAQWFSCSTEKFLTSARVWQTGLSVIYSILFRACELSVMCVVRVCS
jgi:hypothetical protein